MKQLQKGFSLIEILVVIVMFTTLALLVTQSTLRSFQGTRKADASGKVRDNLDFAASVIERHVRNAKSITSTCNGTNITALTYIDQDGRTGSFSCLGGSNMYVASGSANVRITSDDVALSTCFFRCTTTSSVTPPAIDYTFAGVAANAPGSEGSFASITRRILLRVY